jgi:8-oxo-dGTP pyrophosphatase MutT (NUDIX family)
MTIDYLRNKLGSYKPTYFSTPFKPAAVAIIFFRKDDLTHLLFVKRNESLKEHAGQISFPGGRYDLEDAHLLQTVIRETVEEVGISLTFRYSNYFIRRA